MALPQIGLEAVLRIDRFLRNADRYNRAVDSMEKRTAAAAAKMQSSFRGVSSGDPFDLMKHLRELPGGVDSAASSAAGSLEQLSLTFQGLALKAAAAGAAIGIVTVAINKLLDAGEQAAVINDMRLSFQNLAASYGLSAKDMVSSLQEVTRGTIEAADLIRVSNQAMMAGGRDFAEALPQLFQIAEAAAKSSGKSTLEVVDRLVRGIAKGSPKLIDDAEVYLLISDAVEQYARSLNKTVDELEASERQYATLRAVLENHDEIMARVGGTAQASTDPYRRLKAQTKAFGDGLKTLVEPAARDFAEALDSGLNVVKHFIAAYVAFKNVNKDIASILTSHTSIVDALKTEYDKAFQTLSNGMKPLEDTGVEIERIGEISSATARRIDEINQKLDDLYAKYQEKLAAIMLADERRQEDMQRRRIRQREDDERNLSRKLEDMAINNARRREDIARDMADKLADVNDDLARKQRDFDREAQLAREELERKHQDNLAKIRRTSWDDITEAARKNDAVAIARAIRQRQIDVREENISNKIKRRELEIDLAEKQRKLDEDARLTKEKAQEQADDRLAQQMLNEQRQLEDLERFLARQAEDRRIAWARQEEDRKIALQRQLDDLDAWYAKEREKLQDQLQRLTDIATQEIGKAGTAIAKAASNAVSDVASSIGLSEDEQRQYRGNYLGGLGVGSTAGLTAEEQWRRRHEYLARAQGGMDIVNRPTHFVAGEAGPELAAFIPLKNNRLDIGGSVNVDVGGAGTAGMGTAAMEALVYQAMIHVARRIAVAR